MSFFSQQKVWHSWLKKRSPVVVKFKGDPLESKFTKPGEPPEWRIYFNVRGDDEPDKDYYYPIEDESTLEQLRALDKTKWYKVTAGGTPESQFLDIEDAGGATNAGYVPRSNVVSNSGNNDDSFSSGYIVGDYLRCLDEALGICGDKFIKFPADLAVVQAMAATLYIQWSKTGFRTPLSADDAPEREYVSNDRSQEYAEKIEAKIDILPKTSGKAHDGKNLKTAIDKIQAALEDTISDELYGKIVSWLDEELANQGGPPPEIEDELPF